jgi:hypothetical protein
MGRQPITDSHSIADQDKRIERVHGMLCCDCLTLYALSNACPNCGSASWQYGSYPRNDFADLKPSCEDSRGQATG